MAPAWGTAGVVLWRGLGSHLGIYETHPLSVFRELRIVDRFRKLVPRYSGLLALDAGQLLGVQGKEPSLTSNLY
jgi:hypothetical protein